jgi:4-nitrophenyl phosphatase
MATRSKSTRPRVRGVVFDIDGTLALTGPDAVYTPLPGARQVVAQLRAQGVPMVAYTNGTLHTPLEYHENLAGIGMPFEPGRVITPAVVAADYFLKKRIRRVLVLGIEGATRPLAEAGIEVVAPGDRLDGVQAVLIGWFPGFVLADLDAACRAVWNGAALFSVSNAPFFASRGGRMLGVSGAIAAMITSVTGRRATLLGKPAAFGLRMACARMGLRPSEVVVVGDDPTLEVGMARRGGAHAVGVLTGIGNRAAFGALPHNRAAHLVIDSIAEFLDSALVPVAA